MKRALLVVFAACHASSPKSPGFDPTPIFIAGRFEGVTAPDGNSILLESPPVDPAIDGYAAYYIDNILRPADARFCPAR